ncbi:alanine/glycine:cation symporter family protein [Planctomycetota bacterium]
MMDFIHWTNSNILWGVPMLVLIVGTGIFITLRTRFIQIRKFRQAVREVVGKAFAPGAARGELSPFQALTTAIASTVGVGNIAGVATAIAMGGPGAIFWMWVTGFLGMAVNYAEVTLGVHYRHTFPEGETAGGPMYYVKKGFAEHGKVLGAIGSALAILFSICGALAAFGIGNMVQANTLADIFKTTFSVAVPPAVTGVILVVLTGAVILGGIRRIGKVAEKVVPFMAIFYFVGGVIIILLNIKDVPAAFALILKSAFNPTAAVGGFAGAGIKQAMRWGVARGVFSNEAGLGSTPIAHSTARVNHPVEQGVWGLVEVFVDTFIVCTVTALVIITTGVWESGVNGAPLTIMAFEAGLSKMGSIIVTVGIILFAYTTIIVWEYYGEKCAQFLFGTRINLPYRLMWLVLIMVGSLRSLDEVWAIADMLNAMMAIPNLIALVGLSGVVMTLSKDFFEKKTGAVEE